MVFFLNVKVSWGHNVKIKANESSNIELHIMFLLFQMSQNRAEKKEIKKNERKARNQTKNKLASNLAVISKSIKHIIQFSRNDAFKSASLNVLQAVSENEIEGKIIELLNTNYSESKD